MAKGGKVNNADTKMFAAMARGESTFKDRNPPKIKPGVPPKHVTKEKEQQKIKSEQLKALRLAKEAQDKESK